MQNITTWTDDHLPCVGFEHNGVKFEVCWTIPSLFGRLEVIEECGITIEDGLKKYPALLTIINNPFDTKSTDDESIDRDDSDFASSDGNKAAYHTDIGYVIVQSIGETK